NHNISPFLPAITFNTYRHILSLCLEKVNVFSMIYKTFFIKYFLCNLSNFTPFRYFKNPVSTLRIHSLLHSALFKGCKKLLERPYLPGKPGSTYSYLLRHMAVTGAQCVKPLSSGVFRRLAACCCRSAAI